MLTYILYTCVCVGVCVCRCIHKYSTPVSYVNSHLVHVYVCTVYTSTDVLVQMSESLKDILSVCDQLETEYFSVAYFKCITNPKNTVAKHVPGVLSLITVQ